MSKCPYAYYQGVIFPEIYFLIMQKERGEENGGNAFRIPMTSTVSTGGPGEPIKAEEK